MRQIDRLGTHIGILTLGTCAAALYGGEPAPALSGTPVPIGVHGTSITIEPSRVVTWDEMIRIDQSLIGPSIPWIDPAPMAIAPGGELGSRVGAAVEHEPHPVSITESGCSPLIDPGITDSFLALDDNAVNIPPDTMGAVGPDHIVVMLNDRVRIQDRTGGAISTVTLATFWAPASPSSPFDPTVIFDPTSDRWIACVDSHRRSANSRVIFAISASADPTGAWTFFNIDGDPANVAWADFPRMGYNATWIAITNNMFTISGDSFVGASMWVIDKSTALAGGPLTITTFNYGFDVDGGFGTFGTSLTPATTHDAAEPTLWIIDSAGFASGDIQLHRLSTITGTGPAPVWAVAPDGPFPGTGLYPVSTNYSPSTPNAQQLGTATRIATNGARIYDAELRNGHLWYTHVGGLPALSPTRASSFWYEIDTGVPIDSNIVQSGVVDDTGVYHFFPSIAVNCSNDMMLGFTRSSSSIFAEAAFTFQLSTDTPGTTRPVQQIKAGEDSYVKTFGGSSVRWGDYSATVVDPVDDRSMWTIQEYAANDVGPGASDDRWSTWWGHLDAPEVTCDGDVNGDGLTNVADFNILAGNFGAAVPPGTGGDLTGNGFVNVADFNILAGDFGCPF